MAEQEQTTVVTTDTLPDPGDLMRLATGYWGSATLLAANELGVFDAISAGLHSAGEIAAASESPPEAVERLLDACAGLNLLVKQGDRYLLTPAAEQYLVRGRPAYLGSALRWALDQYLPWGRLAEAVREGRPIVDTHRHLGSDPGVTRAFVYGMHERARGVARAVVEFMEPGEGVRLLDVGGGPGTYSLLLAEKHPDLQATVLDLPAVAAVANEIIQESGFGDRVRALGGDALHDDYGESYYDCALFSGVLHQFSAAQILAMLSKAHRALVPGGRIYVSDIMLDAARTQPVFSALFSLQMLLTTESGKVFTAEECKTWLGDAGFHAVEIHRLPEPLPYTILTGRK